MDIQVVQKIDLVMRVTDIGLFLVGGLGAIPPTTIKTLWTGGCGQVE